MSSELTRPLRLHRLPMPLMRWGLGLGVAALGLAALFLVKEFHIALGFLALAVLFASVKTQVRLMLLVALLPLAHAGIGIQSFGGFGLYDIYAGLFLLFFLWRIVVRDLMMIGRFPVLHLTIPMLLFFLPSLLSTSAMSESLKALLQFVASALTAAGVYYLLREENDDALYKRLLTLLVLVATAVSMYGIYEASTTSLVRILTGRVYFSLFEDVNYYASYLLMALALSGGLALASKTLAARLTFAGSTAILTVTVVATVSRSALAVLAVLVVAFAAFMFLSQQGAKRFVGFAILLGFVGALGVVLTTDMGSKLVDLFTLSRRVESVVGGKDASIGQRLTILGVTQRMIQENPVIGVGFGAFEKTFDTYQEGDLSTGLGRSAHNTALRIIAETGVVGFVPSLIFIGALLFYLTRALLRVQVGSDQVLMFALLSSLCSFLLMSLTLDQLFEPHFWVGCGIAVAFAQRNVEQGSSQVNASRRT